MRRGPAAPAPAAKEPEAKAAAESSRHLREKLKKKEAELKHLRKELEDLKEAHLRRLADMENLRKRFEREKSDFQQYALNEPHARAPGHRRQFRAGPPEPVRPTRTGRRSARAIELILRMFQSLLTKQGVRPIVLKDRAFDPNFHHAMTVEESDEVEEPNVDEELQKGYLLHDRLLRPTLVKVLVPKKGQ